MVVAGRIVSVINCRRTEWSEDAHARCDWRTCKTEMLVPKVRISRLEQPPTQLRSPYLSLCARSTVEALKPPTQLRIGSTGPSARILSFGSSDGDSRMSGGNQRSETSRRFGLRSWQLNRDVYSKARMLRRTAEQGSE